MSIELLNKAFKLENISPTKKLILVILCNYADENGSCYPSYKHIAKICGLQTIKSVRNAIKEFEELGILKIQHRKKEDGGFTSNRYFINFDPICLEDSRVEMNSRDVSLRTIDTKEDTKTNIYKKYFNEFWQYYPRKVSKKEAYKVFIKIKEDEIQKVLEKVKEYSLIANKIEKQYIPHPRKWLFHERWNDEEKYNFETKKDYKNLDRSQDWAEDLN